MYLKNLHLLNFKNWQEAELNFHPKLNCFAGSNGSGKTNLLDAIHYLSMCKSYFNTIDSQNIRNEEPFFVVEGEFLKESEDFQIYCAVKNGQKKQFRKNKKEYSRLADHIGQFPSVVISPYDRDLITEGSETRRRFIDGVISQSDALYLDHLIRYNKALQQRNALLKYFAANHTFDESSLEIYDRQLLEHGQPVFEKRKEFTEDLYNRLQQNYTQIAGEGEETELRYKSDFFSDNFEELLKMNRQKDRVLQYSGVGIHKDDLRFSLNSRNLKKFGSQGQQKSYLIALKLAQYHFLADKQGVKPILLLDDIFDKLDEKRVSQLVQLVHKEDFGQIFITDTHSKRTENLLRQISPEYLLFNVENAVIL